MGLEQSVTFSATVPSWLAVRALLERHQFSVQVRMLDGLPAFPDEQPGEDWRELRLGTPAGMITVRREPKRLAFVVWGNADAGLLQACNALMWAFAQIGAGRVLAGEVAHSAAEFHRGADLPAGLRVD